MITNDQYTRSSYVRTISYFRQSIAELHNADILMKSVSLHIDIYSKYGVSFEGTHEACEIPSSEKMKSGRLYWECPEHLWSRESRADVWKKFPLDFSKLSCRRSSKLNSQHSGRNDVTLSQCRRTTGRSEARRRSLMYVCIPERSNSSWSCRWSYERKITYVVNSMNYVSSILTAVRWVDQSAIDVDQLTLNRLRIPMIIFSSSLQYGWSTRSHFHQMKRRMIESFLIGRDCFSLTEKIRTEYLTENTTMTTLLSDREIIIADLDDISGSRFCRSDGAPWILHAWIRRSKTSARSFKSDDPCNRLMYTQKYHLLKGYVLTDFLHEEQTEYILY